MRVWQIVSMGAIKRREFVAGLIGVPFCAGNVALGQGIASRGVKPQPRGKASGIPFQARFVDVAQEAGLVSPVVYGERDKKEYILETVGCGCAFIDYDNDGWMDLFVLTGTRFGNAPAEASNRLYRNNRDGTFADVTEKAGLRWTGWGSGVCTGDFNNDGFEDLVITYWRGFIVYLPTGVDSSSTGITAMVHFPT
jgi:hypothetical protein